MLKVNEYFDGKVKSIGFDNFDGNVTVGVMKAGEYEFGTSTIEIMTVVSGKMDVMLPGENDWTSYKPFESFQVEKDKKFKVKMVEPVAYKCEYL